MDSISAGMTSAISALQQNKTGQAIGMAVVNKAQDLQKQQGEATLALINSAAVSSRPGGIDTYA